jgi:hypothetical protein
MRRNAGPGFASSCIRNVATHEPPVYLPVYQLTHDTPSLPPAAPASCSNYTGNRVTCRDWFQLSLKEGLTVYRDQVRGRGQSPMSWKKECKSSTCACQNSVLRQVWWICMNLSRT